MKENKAERYAFRVSFVKAASRQSLVIMAEAQTDGDAIRTAHALADFAEFSGGSDVKVMIVGENRRDVGVVADDIQDNQWAAYERQHRIGADYSS